jgi:hypothetical protein
VEWFGETLLERTVADLEVKCPSGGSVPDHEHALTIPRLRQFVEKPADSLDGFSPALAAGKWLVEPTAPLGV